MFRALAVLWAVLWVNQAVLTVTRWGDYPRPGAAAVILAAMAGWTAFAGWAHLSAPRRTPVLLAADLLVAVAALAATPWVKGEGWSATMPGFWVAGALLAWAIRYRWVGGLVAGVVLSTADVALRLAADRAVTQGVWGNLFLLVIAGTVVGYVAQSVQRLAAERTVAERAAATAAERARLARAVHDGVLQVLALAQRRGGEPGGDPELGRLAGEQETLLRRLIRQQDTLVTPHHSAGARDLPEPATLDVARGVEEAVARRTLQASVVTPGSAVDLPRAVGADLLAAVGACLDNVTRHVGEQAPVWLLVEDLGDAVVVTVRDEGPGLAAGRPAAAAAEGRLGVSESIRGRLHDLGGRATLVSAPGQGTEWELSVPRTARR